MKLILESSVIVVINEDTKSIDIFEFTVLLIKSVFEVLHALSRSKNILDGEVHWIVEKTGEIVRVWTNVIWISVKAFTHLENTSSLAVLAPETFFNFWDCVDSDTIELIGIDQVLDPIFKILSNITVTLVKIWKISKSAVLYLTLIIPVVNLAIAVIMLRSIQRIDLTEITSNWSNVIGNDVDHDSDSFRVSSVNKGFKIILTSEVRIDLLPVSCPVTMISWIQVINDW